MSVRRAIFSGLLMLPVALSQTVTITAPANNMATAPGQTVNFTVSMSPVTDFTAVSLSGSTPLGLIGAQASAVSVSFSLVMPTYLRPASYAITAIGYSTTGSLVISAPVTLLVGGTGTPSSLTVNPAQLSFTSVGASLPVLLGGKLASGTTEDLSVSPSVTWISSNPAVATVSADGVVTSVANGNATITAKLGTSLSATVSVGVNAPASSCTYNVPSSAAAPASGVAITVNVVASATCEWSAVSWSPWISVTAGTLGSGSGPVTLAIAGNSGASRIGTVAIAGQNFTITQAASIGSVAVPAIIGGGVVNGASFVSGGLVPGEIATIFGTNLTTAAGINLASALPLATQLLSVRVLVNGTSSPVFAVDKCQRTAADQLPGSLRTSR